MKKLSYKFTMGACLTGYVVQSITVNFPPLLYVMFMEQFCISYEQISFLISFMFIVQLCVDVTLSKVLTSKNVRAIAVIANSMVAIGLTLLAVLPNIMTNKFLALIIAKFFYSCGSGVMDVMVSPIVEACPTTSKSGSMAFTHSFYCWGTALTIITATVFFAVFGTENWQILALLFAILPIIDAIAMAIMPIGNIESDKAYGSNPFKYKIFFIAMALMLASGAAELAIGQWASTFAEKGLNITKSAGDLAGPCMFAIMMGIGRILYTMLVKKIRLINYMLLSGAICIFGYILAGFAPNPIISLIGIAVCGLSVAILWPGMLSLTVSKLGSSSMLFGILACCGDFGCTVGPAMIGFISEKFGGNISMGLKFGVIFPIVVFGLLLIFKYSRRPIKD